jgi:hypothetical protein
MLITPSKEILMLKGVQEAFKSSGVFYYEIKNLSFSEEGLIQEIVFKASKSSFFSDFIGFFEKSGARVVSIDYDKEYKISLDLENFSPFVPLEDSLVINNISKDVWIDIKDSGGIIIESKSGNRWYPRVFIYDCNLVPLEVIKGESWQRKIEIALPKGSCYIKISDRFTLKNMKYGIKIYRK